MASEEKYLGRSSRVVFGRQGPHFGAGVLEALVSVCVLGGKWQGGGWA